MNGHTLPVIKIIYHNSKIEIILYLNSSTLTSSTEMESSQIGINFITDNIKNY